MTDIASRASSTGESWGRRVAALIRRPTGAFLSVGLSDPSLPEQYFVQHFDYFFKGMDAKMCKSFIVYTYLLQGIVYIMDS